MFEANPFAVLNGFLPPLFMQAYLVLMVLAVVAGTLYDVRHKASGLFFAQRRRESAARARRRLSGGERLAIAIGVVAEAAVSGEFCRWPRRISHLMTMYGFLAYVITTVVMAFGYPDGAETPAMLPALWTLGALMVLIGGLWFFFFLRVNVAHDGDSPFSLSRADLFIGALLASAAFALIWHLLGTTIGDALSTRVVFGLWIFFSTLLFATVPWSKFAHMFFKPAVRYQRRIEEADGSSDLPTPSTQNFIVRG